MYKFQEMSREEFLGLAGEINRYPWNPKTIGENQFVAMEDSRDFNHFLVAWKKEPTEVEKEYLEEEYFGGFGDIQSFVREEWFD